MRTPTSPNLNQRRRGRPTQVDRELLLGVAEDLFAAKGYQGATVRMLARKVKCNPALICYHFGSKEGLYQAVLIRHFETSIERARDLEEMGKIPGELEQQWPEFEDLDQILLCATLYAFADNMLGNANLQKIIFREMMAGGSQMIAALGRSQAGMIGALGTKIERLISEKKIKKVDVGLTIISFLGAICYSFLNSAVIGSVFKLNTLDSSYLRSLVCHLTKTFFEGCAADNGCRADTVWRETSSKAHAKGPNSKSPAPRHFQS